jgi:FtsH-binding integral membrane protein
VRRKNDAFPKENMYPPLNGDVPTDAIFNFAMVAFVVFGLWNVPFVFAAVRAKQTLNPRELRIYCWVALSTLALLVCLGVGITAYFSQRFVPFALFFISPVFLGPSLLSWSAKRHLSRLVNDLRRLP